MAEKKCPICKSIKIKLEVIGDLEFIKCESCGFDESQDYEVYPEEKSGQKGKSGFTPYKRGGGSRSRAVSP